MALTREEPVEEPAGAPVWIWSLNHGEGPVPWWLDGSRDHIDFFSGDMLWAVAFRLFEVFANNIKGIMIVIGDHGERIWRRIRYVVLFTLITYQVSYKGGQSNEEEDAHRNMNSIESATLLPMQRPKNSQKKEDMT